MTTLPSSKPMDSSVQSVLEALLPSYNGNSLAKIFLFPAQTATFSSALFTWLGMQQRICFPIRNICSTIYIPMYMNCVWPPPPINLPRDGSTVLQGGYQKILPCPLIIAVYILLQIMMCIVKITIGYN